MTADTNYATAIMRAQAVFGDELVEPLGHGRIRIAGREYRNPAEVIALCHQMPVRHVRVVPEAVIEIPEKPAPIRERHNPHKRKDRIVKEQRLRDRVLAVFASGEPAGFGIVSVRCEGHASGSSLRTAISRLFEAGLIESSPASRVGYALYTITEAGKARLVEVGL